MQCRHTIAARSIILATTDHRGITAAIHFTVIIGIITLCTVVTIVSTATRLDIVVIDVIAIQALFINSIAIQFQCIWMLVEYILNKKWCSCHHRCARIGVTVIVGEM